MKKITLTIALLAITSLCLHAQIPMAFNYTSIALDNKGKELSNSELTVRASILHDLTNGVITYSETHRVQTDNKGLFSISIGRGVPESGSFASIAWEMGPTYLSVAINSEGGADFVPSGTVELLSVPYALHAGTSGGDPSDMNELITDVMIEGNVITLSEGENETQIDLNPVLTDLPDTDPENELQTLTLTDRVLAISNGNSVLLPDAGNGGGGSYYYFDGDGDTFGDPSRPVWVPENVSAPTGFVSASGDTNDSDPGVYPGSDPVDPCQDDEAAGFCAAAWNLGSVSPGGIVTYSGVLKEDQTEDWFTVSNPSLGEEDPDTFQIQLSDQYDSNESFRMDIYYNCTTIFRENITSFIDGGLSPHPSQVLIRVYRPDGDYSGCESYLLHISK